MQYISKNLIRGIIPPLVTPLFNNDNPDVEGFERLTEHTINGGIHGIFILGITGSDTRKNIFYYSIYGF